MADQIASGLSNIVLLIAGARVGTPEEFGVLSATTIALTALLSISRASLGNSIVLLAGGGPKLIRQASTRASALVLLLAPAIMVLIGMVGWMAGRGQFSGLVVLLSAGAPFMIIQDLLRFEGSALTRSRLAFGADLAWLVLMLLALATLPHLGASLDVLSVTVAWAAGGVSAMVILSVGLHSRPHFAGLKAWARHHRKYLTHSSGGTTLVSAANIARVSLVGAVVGPVVVGSLAAGQLVMTPLNLLVALIPFAATPVIARRWAPVAAVAPYAGLAVATSILGVLWWALLSTIPDQVGTTLLGEVWLPASRLLAPMALLSIGVLVTSTAMSLLLYLGRPTSFSTVALIVAVLSITATMVVLALGGGVEALAWGQASVVALGAALSWYLAVRARMRLRAELGI